MKRQRRPYARYSVWYVVLVLAIVVVIGFAAAGYEINHLRTQVNGLQTQVNSVNKALTNIYALVLELASK
jgi:NADH:ubiquinone oxidoreductase subunit 6 (subunit J)